MITIQPSSGAVTFVFDGNQYYLNDGSISYPLNTLSMTIDDSDIVSFKNQAGDIVLGCHLEELGKTKAEMEALYESSFVGGAGVTPEDVAEMIDEAVSGKQDTSGMTAYTTTATTDALNTVVTAHTANTIIHVTSADKTNWNAKVDRSDLDAYATTTALDNHTANTTVHVTSTDKTNWDAKVDQADLDEYAMADDVNEALEVATRALFDVRDDATQALTQLGGNSIVALTQAEYDALTTKDAHTLFIITE